MPLFTLVYPSGVQVTVEAVDEEDARNCGFTFGAELRDETPADESVETKQAA